MTNFLLVCQATGNPCEFNCIPQIGECAEKELNRIGAMSDKELMDEHLARYGGDKKLAGKSLDLMKARAQKAMAKTYKH